MEIIHKILQHLLYYISAYNFGVLLVTAIILIGQVISQNTWNRKKAALDLINMLYQGDLLRIKNELDRYLISPEFHKITYEEIAKRLSKEEKDKLDTNLEIYLNFLEGIAVGIKYKVYKENMLYDYIGFLVPQVVRWSKPYILTARERFNNSTIYLEVEKLAQKWEKKNKEEEKRKTINPIKG